MSEKKFAVEYARSGRAACRTCKKTIANKSLKVCLSMYLLIQSEINP